MQIIIVKLVLVTVILIIVKNYLNITNITIYKITIIDKVISIVENNQIIIFIMTIIIIEPNYDLITYNKDL